MGEGMKKGEAPGTVNGKSARWPFTCSVARKLFSKSVLRGPGAWGSGRAVRGGIFAAVGAGAGAGGGLASNECPTGLVCNDFGHCEAPTTTTDGGVPPAETEYSLGTPITA